MINIETMNSSMKKLIPQINLFLNLFPNIQFNLIEELNEINENINDYFTKDKRNIYKYINDNTIK